ncbi:ribonuclease domain-containing protein [Spirosoma soli]|uniref:Ribonuclease domain-containing protein n=1 Tax=Spirosoma soli TaxID=1770529 RepID=A0ABW5MBT6_9BACT
MDEEFLINFGSLLNGAMVTYSFRCFWYITLLLLFLLSTGCRTDQHERTTEAAQSQNKSAGSHTKHHRHHRHNQKSAENKYQAQESLTTTDAQIGDVPAKVLEVLDYIRQNGRAPNGYVGGRTFGNFENHLPKTDASGRRIRYQEWDVNPKIKGQNRGVERLVTGSDNRAYFTRDHYNSFIEIK